MKIIVTGANGYLAQGIINALLAKGFEVEGIARGASQISHPKYAHIEADAFAVDFTTLAAEPDTALLHAAWTNGFKHQHSDHLRYLPEHVTLLENAIKAGIKNINVIGTMHEVGYHVGEVNERTPTEPLSPYGIAKNALRQWLTVASAEAGIRMKWLRAFYIVSADARSNSIFSKLYATASTGGTDFPLNSGRSQYDFISFEEFCGLATEATTQTLVTGTINVCSGTPVALLDKVEEFVLDNELKLNLNVGAFPDRPYDSPAIWGDTTKIRKIHSLSSTKS